MSHISSYNGIKIKDQQLFLKMANRMGSTIETFRVEKNVRMYGRNEVKATASLKVPGWKYPIALDKEGTLHYDHWGSQPGSMETLHKIVQEYSRQHIINHIPVEAQSWFEKKTEKNEIVIEINY